VRRGRSRAARQRTVRALGDWLFPITIERWGNVNRAVPGLLRG